MGLSIHSIQHLKQLFKKGKQITRTADVAHKSIPVRKEDLQSILRHGQAKHEGT